MSFLKPAAAMGAAGDVNPAAAGLGHLFNADPSRISSIADRIGRGANMIAAGGGAAPGYAAPPEMAPANHLQMIDPAVLRSIMDRFGMNRS